MNIPAHKIRAPQDGEHVQHFCLFSDFQDVTGKDIYESDRVEIELGYVLPMWGKVFGTVKFSPNGFYVETDDGALYALHELIGGVRIVDSPNS